MSATSGLKRRKQTPRSSSSASNGDKAGKLRTGSKASFKMAVVIAMMPMLLVATLEALYFSSSKQHVAAAPAVKNPQDDDTTTSRRKALQLQSSLADSSSTPQGGANADAADANASLTLRDFVVTKCLGRGSINVAFLAKLRSKEVRRVLGLPPNDEDAAVVLKLADTTTYGHAEIESFERIRNRVDASRAAAVGLPRAHWTARDVANPYYCPRAAQLIDDPHDEEDWGDDDKVCVKGYGAWPRPTGEMSVTAFQKMRSFPTVDAVVMPYYNLDTLQFSDKDAQNITTVKIFFRSMLEQLQVAHDDASVNNLDLNVPRNMFIDRATGRSILFDWNSYIPVGKPAVDHNQNWKLAAPEAWMFDGFGVEPLVRSVHAMDVWQSAVVLATFLYYPCTWSSGSKVLQDKKKSEAKQKYLQTILKRIGGNTRIPLNLNGTEEVDLRVLAGMPTDTDIPRPATFEPLLGKKQKRTCSKAPSWYLDDPAVSDGDKKVALDLLQQMFTLSPEDRPTMATLLQHPFFQ
eukprot:CAMPEP_0178588066 /NCGR_PEP_ID=MMETSP0697-20121206/26815_1 /TAXON_ID=265572 /ORGANISM="Extubocellulus spinifer, Strain CCMP396" /LENGTH=518 /DNA_ID=CAMNT_0020224351 /DNA_START=105 /DNA_END=1661 /DNA_ORIENTATION=+